MIFIIDECLNHLFKDTWFVRPLVQKQKDIWFTTFVNWGKQQILCLWSWCMFLINYLNNSLFIKVVDTFSIDLLIDKLTTNLNSKLVEICKKANEILVCI